MIHYAEPDFWAAYDLLPSHVKSLADRNFELLKRNPRHPSLHFKRIGSYWAVRVGLRYRALGIADGDDVVWFWIGSHAEYDRLLKS